MLESVLIANRGEIACRIIKTARRMGLRTIAVYSDADRNALHVRAADAAVAIGPAPSSESYLVADRILDAARQTQAASVHPGYGFLSENADFAQACADSGIVFIGPSADAIRAMGLKDGAKALMERAGVPVVPGYHGEKQEAEFLKRKAYEVGYPVLIKAVAGGGGKGMRRVDKAIDFDAALESAKREARSAFGDDRVLIEKFILNPRHVEIQIFGDGHGGAVHLFERDCSAQRRHQKVLEEAPAPGMSPETRMAMGKAAVAAAKAVNYAGAGTVEFIADGGGGTLKPDGFWFMEMNTRLQVEHPVSELVTGEDLVEWQFRVAAGEGLPKSQDEIRLNGHAIEARLYAEDPDQGFLPSTGTLDILDISPGAGIRIDTGVEQGSDISAYYDPMIAKIIAHGMTRAEALDRLAVQFRASVIAGPKNNLAFLTRLIDHPEVSAGGFDTGLIDRDLADLTRGHVSDEAVESAAALVVTGRTTNRPETNAGWVDPFEMRDAFQLSGPRESVATVAVDGMPREVRVCWREDGARAIPAIEGIPIRETARWAGDAVYAFEDGRAVKVTLVDHLARVIEDAEGASAIKAPMHGKVIAVDVSEGVAVTKGERLAVVEAMKMEHAITAPRDGVVGSVFVAEGDQVDQGAPVVALAEDDSDAES